MKKHILSSLHDSLKCLETFLRDDKALNNIEKVAQIMLDSIKQGNKIISCGNGGSMCDAMHFAEELSGKYRDNRKGLPASSISDPSYLSCVANDFGYEDVFSRYIEAHGKANDVLLAISTSGTSKNVIKAARLARENEIHVITLTGKEDSELGKLATLDISTPSYPYADRIQELHIKIIHILIELIERDIFPENYMTYEKAIELQTN